MKLSLSLVLLFSAAVCQLCSGEESTTKQKIQENKNEKRTLLEGNEGVMKRAPETASPPSPGVEYADGKEDKTLQIYATPVPEISKISDLLTGQTPVAFPTAIAHHLFSPVSVYQPRLGSPTTYEVSAPVPAQLAYSEHKIYQPVTQPLQKAIPQNNKPAFGRLTLNHNQQPLEQPVFYQQQPILYPQQLQPSQFAPAQLYQYNNQLQQPQYQPQPYAQIPQQVSYSNAPASFYPQNNFQYSQNQQPFLQVFHSIQPGVTYARQQNVPNVEYSDQQLNYQRSNLRDSKASQSLQRLPERPLLPQNNYIDKPQGAVSYASFSQNQQNYAAPLNQNPSEFGSVKQDSAANSILPPKSPSQQVLYIRPGHLVQNLPYQQANQPQQQLYQNPHPQPFQGHGILVQSPNYAAPQPLQLASNFAPVQYFGKFAESIFGNYRQ